MGSYISLLDVIYTNYVFLLWIRQGHNLSRFQTEVFMAKPKIEKKDPDLQELIRDYWQSLHEETEKQKPIRQSRVNRGSLNKALQL